MQNYRNIKIDVWISQHFIYKLFSTVLRFSSHCKTLSGGILILKIPFIFTHTFLARTYKKLLDSLVHIPPTP